MGLKITVVEFRPVGGLFHFALQMSEALAEAGHTVELVTGAEPEFQPRVPGVHLRPILATGNRPPTGSRLARKVRRAVHVIPYVESWRRVAMHIRRSRPDVVQLASLRYAVDGLIAAWLAGGRNAPVTVDVVHEPRLVTDQRRRGSLQKRSPLLRMALSAAYRRMDAVLVLGDQAAAKMRQTWPGVRRVEVIPHGDEGIFESVARGVVRPPDACPQRVLFFGTWTRYKGLEVLLDAFALVRRRLPEAELVLAGAANNDVDVGGLLARAAAVGGVQARPGYVPAAEVPGLLGSCRVVVAPYLTATQSGVVHLAQTFSRPVVATDVGDLAAVVSHGETGLLVRPDDAGALADALERLLRDPAEAARMGRDAKDRLAARASWTRVADQVIPVYEELVEASRVRASAS